MVGAATTTTVVLLVVLVGVAGTETAASVMTAIGPMAFMADTGAGTTVTVEVADPVRAAVVAGSVVLMLAIEVAVVMAEAAAAVGAGAGAIAAVTTVAVAEAAPRGNQWM